MPLRFAFLLGFGFLLASCSSPPSVSNFYHRHKTEAGVRNFTIPGWLVFLGTSVAQPFVRDADTRRSLALAKKVKKVQVMIDEDGHHFPPTAVSRLARQAREDGYEDLLLVRDQETRVNLMVRERKGRLRHLLVLVRDEGDFVFLNIKTSIRPQDLVELVSHLLREEDEEEPTTPIADIPQV